MQKFALASLILSLLNGAALAQSGDPFRMLPRDKPEIQRSKPVRAPANPCAAFGPGFARVEGSDTCVKVGGSIGVSVGSGSSGMTMPR